MEKPKTIEYMGKNREKLLNFEKSGKYVFHGSPFKDLKNIEPRQAYKGDKKDGNPAVFATPYADVAIFRALINQAHAKEISSFKSGFKLDKNNTLHFSTTKNILDNIKTKTGYVYVLDKENFQKINNMESKSLDAIKPIEIIEVKVQDLPKDIELF